MRYLFWFVIVVVVLALAHGYVGWRFIRSARLPPPWRSRAWIIVGFVFVIPLGTFLFEVNQIEKAWLDQLSWVGYLILGFVSLCLTLLVIRDVVGVAASAGRKLVSLFRHARGTGDGQDGSTDPGRRQFLLQAGNAAVMGIAGGLTVYGLYEARRRPSIVEFPIPLSRLPDDLEGFRILQITDIHAGLTVRRGFVQTVVEMANTLTPDLIAFTGDLVDGSVSHLREDVAPMAELSARHGRFFITGNHEYYSGAEAWIEEARRLGFDVLLNEHRVVERGAGRILLAGVTDYSAGQFIPRHASNPEAAIAGAPACDVRILLAHQPRSLYASAPLGFDLQISGHTHGGQFFPWNLLATVGQPYISGLHRHRDMWVYVSRGTGYWGPPIRLATRSEITLFRLTRGW